MLCNQLVGRVKLSRDGESFTWYGLLGTLIAWCLALSRKAFTITCLCYYYVTVTRDRDASHGHGHGSRYLRSAKQVVKQTSLKEDKSKTCKSQYWKGLLNKG